jgi:flagellin-like protein
VAVTASLRADERGASGVIATILMVGVAVIAGGLVAAVVLGIVDPSSIVDSAMEILDGDRNVTAVPAL